MREVAKVIQTTEYTVVNKEIKNEEFVSIYENKSLAEIVVSINQFNSNGEISAVKELKINGDNYTMLMSEKPEFAPNKPANEYREEDLWYVVDLIDGYK